MTTFGVMAGSPVCLEPFQIQRMIITRFRTLEGPVVTRAEVKAIHSLGVATRCTGSRAGMTGLATAAVQPSSRGRIAQESGSTDREDNDEHDARQHVLPSPPKSYDRDVLGCYPPLP